MRTLLKVRGMQPLIFVNVLRFVLPVRLAKQHRGESEVVK
jgi:hypothetical protein